MLRSRSHSLPLAVGLTLGALLPTLLSVRLAESGAERVADSSGASLQLDSPAPPETDLLHQPDFDFFAWNSFVAMFWPALDPESHNDQRGFPDLEQSFVDAGPGTLTVWETFKEKREVFNFPVSGSAFPGDPAALPPWNHPLDYGPIRPAGDEMFEGPYDSSLRVLATTSKQHHYDSFDETIEVVSENLETTYPDGSDNPLGPVPGVRSGRPVGPRVWRGEPSPENAVFYEVKVNYDYYRYVAEHDYNVAAPLPPGTPVNDNTNDDALQGLIAFPYRTSAPAGPKRQQPQADHQIVIGYSAADTNAAYAEASPSTDLTPPAVGSIQIKAAWVILSADEAASGRYHTAEATYFTTVDGEPRAQQATFGLVGIHIIQRIHTASGETSADARGGTFVFATFEHVDNDTAGYTYSNYYDPLNDPAFPAATPDGPYPPELPLEDGKPYPADFYPALTDAYPVVRRFQPISQQAPRPLGTKEVNEAVWAAIKARNPGSVWLNYQLIGTQFQAVDVTAVAAQERPGQPPQTPYPETRYPVTEYDPTGIGQPAYLANLVIETNADLQLFQGIPPGVPTIDKYSGVGVAPNETLNYDRSGNNLSFARSGYNMGGCMGCHGVAQTLGYSFSFVLKGGYAGATTDTQSHFDVAGASHQEE